MKCIAHFSVNAPLNICEQLTLSIMTPRYLKASTLFVGIPFNINVLANVICLSLCGEPTTMDSHFSPATATLDPGPRHWTLDPRLWTRDPQPATRNPRPATRDY